MKYVDIDPNVELSGDERELIILLLREHEEQKRLKPNGPHFFLVDVMFAAGKRWAQERISYP